LTGAATIQHEPFKLDDNQIENYLLDWEIDISFAFSSMWLIVAL
jgi:hypothetical protein